jgi:hypothetical protein
MTERMQSALMLRDRAVSLCHRDGTWEACQTPSNTPLRILVATCGDLTFSHRTPFQRLPPAPILQDHTRAVLMQRAPSTLPYGLDIWAHGKKVFSVQWGGDVVEIISFQRGEWEQRL